MVDQNKDPLEYDTPPTGGRGEMKIEDKEVGKHNTYKKSPRKERDDLPRKRWRGVIALLSFRTTHHNRNGWSINNPGATIATFITSARTKTVMSIEPSATVLPAPLSWKALTA